jgi:hypothetical protein
MATLDQLHTRVEAPLVQPHPFGLFSVAPPSTPGDGHWQAGVAWDSLACIDPNTTTDPCINGGAAPGAKEFEQCPNYQAYKPITVYFGIKRTGQSYDVGEAQVRQVMEDAGEYAIEKYLWEQMVAAEPPVAFPKKYTTGSPLIDALAAIEGWLGSHYHGTGVIHMNRGAAAALGGTLVRDGTHLATLTGTPVVAGAGYNLGVLEDPEDEPIVMFGSGAVVVRSGDIDVVSAWNLAINDELVLGERTYVVGWDCALIGITVPDIP